VTFLSHVSIINYALAAPLTTYTIYFSLYNTFTKPPQTF